MSTTTMGKEEKQEKGKEEKQEMKRKREGPDEVSDSDSDSDSDEAEEDLAGDGDSDVGAGGDVEAMEEEKEEEGGLLSSPNRVWRFQRLSSSFYWDNLIRSPSPSSSSSSPSRSSSPPPPSPPSSQLPPLPPPKFPAPGPADIQRLHDLLVENVYIKPDHPEKEHLDYIYYMAGRKVCQELDEDRYRQLRLTIRDWSLDAHEDKDFPASEDELMRVSDVRRIIKEQDPHFEMWKHDTYKNLMIADIRHPHPYAGNPYSFLEVLIDPVRGIRYYQYGVPEISPRSSSRAADEQRLKFRQELDDLFPGLPTTKEEDKQFFQAALDIAKRSDFNHIGFYEVYELVRDHTEAVDWKIRRNNARDSLKNYISELHRDKVTSIDLKKKLRDLCRAYDLCEDEVKVFIEEVLRCEDADTHKKIDEYLELKSKALQLLEREASVTDYLNSKIAVANRLVL